ncbi:hypothetical protein ACYCFK_17750 [Stutzerimonas stutzeri]
MTPREKEIALEAAGRSSDPVTHARKMIEAEAFLRGEHPPFVVWPKKAGHFRGELVDALSHEEKAAWHEAQAAIEREIAIDHAEFMRLGEGRALSRPEWQASEPNSEQGPTDLPSGAAPEGPREEQTESPAPSGCERN